MMCRILVVAPSWIGDTLMTQSLFAQLKAQHPRVQIHAIVPKWVVPMPARMPEIVRVLPTDLAHGKLQLGSRTMFAQQLRDETSDAAYVPPNSFKSALVPWLTDTPLHTGHKGESYLGVLNVRYLNPPKNVHPPMVQYYTALVSESHAKLSDTLPGPKLDIDAQRMTATSVKFSVPGSARLIVFRPGAEYDPARRQSAEHFVELTRVLRHSFPYTQIVTLGSGKNRETASAIVERAPFVHNLCGETSLDEAIELFARTEAAICDDSNLMYVATALGRPQVAVSGFSGSRHTSPLSPVASIMQLHLECSLCFAHGCLLGHLRCLHGISPEIVFYGLCQPLQPQ